MKRLIISMVILAIIFISLTVYITYDYYNVYLRNLHQIGCERMRDSCFVYAGITKLFH